LGIVVVVVVVVIVLLLLLLLLYCIFHLLLHCVRLLYHF